MPVDRPTFSDSWYRVAELRPRLRAAVQTYRQHYRGQMFTVVRDPANNQFFRLNDAAYHFVGLLDGRRTVSEVWNISNEHLGDRAPTQGEAIQLLGQLYTANLLQAELPPDSEGMFERYRKRVGREVRGYMSNLLFVRIPLFDPERLLDRWIGAVGWVFGWPGLIGWLLLLAVGAYHLAGRFGDLVYEGKNILGPQNDPKWEIVILLGLTWIMLKALHEFGHGVACKRFGQPAGSGEVHTIGIMFLVFMPVPYVDASSAWALRSKWQRAIIAAAGIYVELAVAAVAAIVWAQTGPDAEPWHRMAYNLMFLASISTLLFNGNPLLRYDGYYILSDLLEIPNLAQRSREHLYYFVKKYIYGVRRPRKIAHTASEARWLGVYAVASTIYRVFICVAILLFVADKAFFLGAILAALAVVTWVFVPVGKFLRYLFTGDEVARVRVRALATTGVFLAAVIIGIGAIRVPDRARAEGVIEPRRLEFVYMGADGFIDSFQPTGTQVSPDGPPLLTAHNRQLQTERQIQLAKARWLNLQYKLAEAEGKTALRQSFRMQLKAAAGRLQHLDDQIAALAVSAPFDGTWIAPQVEHSTGLYLSRGEQIGLVATVDDLIVRVVADQRLGPRIFNDLKAGTRVEIRVMGQPNRPLIGRITKLYQAGQRRLPSAALGYLAGGAVPIALDDPQGTRATEPFFQFLIDPVDVPDGALSLSSGQRVVVRFEMPAKPLIQQWIRRIQQMVQQRFQM